MKKELSFIEFRDNKPTWAKYFIALPMHGCGAYFVVTDTLRAANDYTHWYKEYHDARHLLPIKKII